MGRGRATKTRSPTISYPLPGSSHHRLDRMMAAELVRLDGEWIIAAPSGDDVDQDPTVWRIEYVRSDDIAGQLPGKVYIRLTLSR